MDFVVVVGHSLIWVWRGGSGREVVIVRAECNGGEGALTTRSVDNSIVWLLGRGHQASMRCGAPLGLRGSIMAKRKKGSKAQKRKAATVRGKARKPSKAAKATKPTAAKAKPKPAPVKKVARKVKQPVTPVIETAAVEMIEQPAPDVITVTEVEETEVRKAS